MEPWIIDAAAAPDLALRIRQTGREVASVGGYLWDMIGRETLRLGYACTEHVASERATHVVLTK